VFTSSDPSSQSAILSGCTKHLKLLHTKLHRSEQNLNIFTQVEKANIERDFACVAIRNIMPNEVSFATATCAANIYYAFESYKHGKH
jgi:hypothetical protein